MAITSFIPELWAKDVDTAREEALIFASICNRNYEGEIKKLGDTVHIPFATRPTIRRIDVANAGNDLTSEDLTGSTVDLTISKMAYYDFRITDADKLQAVSGTQSVFAKDAGLGLAVDMDKFIANVAGSTTSKYLDASAVKITTDNVLTKLDAAAQKLYEANVPLGAEIYAVVSPRFWTLLKTKYASLATNNMDALGNGAVAKYGNMIIKMSNSIDTASSGAQDHIVVCTNKALAFANTHTKTEALRDTAKFADIVRGYSLFGAVVARPDELAIINAKYTD